MVDKMNPDNLQRYDLLVITGPTASGKTSFAATMAKKLNGEIICADSRQVYRHMDIGTGKDYNDYIVDRTRIPCHLMDIADPGYKYNVFEYQRDFLISYNDLRQRGVFPVVCGGSGMYIDSIVSGYRMYEVPPDPDLRAGFKDKSLEELTEILSSYKELHNITDVDTRKRAIRAIEIEQFNLKADEKQRRMPELKSLVIGIAGDRLKRRGRITARLRQRLDQGMIDEVRKLLASGLKPEELIYYGLEYKYITLYLTGRLNYDEMFDGLETAIHQFAKRQMTWFRGMERRGIKIHWIDSELPAEIKVQEVMSLL
jgi:tRNA dimethylallyltransferase